MGYQDFLEWIRFIKAIKMESKGYITSMQWTK